MTKIANYVLYVLLIVCVLVAVLFGAGKVTEDALLYLAYALLGIAAAAVAILMIAGMFKSKQSIIRSGILILIVGAILGIAYSLSSGAMPNFYGAENYELTASSLKFIDTMLYTLYIAFVGAVLSIVFIEVKSSVE